MGCDMDEAWYEVQIFYGADDGWINIHGVGGMLYDTLADAQEVVEEDGGLDIAYRIVEIRIVEKKGY
jgi:hypothetical protein